MNPAITGGLIPDKMKLWDRKCFYAITYSSTNRYLDRADVNLMYSKYKITPSIGRLRWCDRYSNTDMMKKDFMRQTFMSKSELLWFFLFVFYLMWKSHIQNWHCKIAINNLKMCSKNQWRHYGRDGVSNQPHHCLLNSQRTSRVTPHQWLALFTKTTLLYTN